MSDNNLSAVKSTVTAAGTVMPADANGAIPGAPVALPTDGAVAEYTTTSPIANSEPDEPLVRVMIWTLHFQIALVTPEPRVIVPESASNVPATPPHRSRQRPVGAEVVLYLPHAHNSSALPSAM